MSSNPVILCVDDTPSFLEGYKMLLEENGYRVLTATEGKQAVEVFKSCEIDLVLLDYHMPEMNGAAAALQMKKLNADVPILLLSSDERLPQDDLAAVDCFVPKSESMDDLLGKVDYLLSLRLLFQPLETLKRRFQKAA
jgi:two-component system, CitB family, response regulator DctR